MFIMLSWFKGFSGEGDTIREDTLIRRNTVYFVKSLQKDKMLHLSKFKALVDIDSNVAKMAKFVIG